MSAEAETGTETKAETEPKLLTPLTLLQSVGDTQLGQWLDWFAIDVANGVYTYEVTADGVRLRPAILQAALAGHFRLMLGTGRRVWVTVENAGVYASTSMPLVIVQVEPPLPIPYPMGRLRCTEVVTEAPSWLRR